MVPAYRRLHGGAPTASTLRACDCPSCGPPIDRRSGRALTTGTPRRQRATAANMNGPNGARTSLIPGQRRDGGRTKSDVRVIVVHVERTSATASAVLPATWRQASGVPVRHAWFKITDQSELRRGARAGHHAVPPTVRVPGSTA